MQTLPAHGRHPGQPERQVRRHGGAVGYAAAKRIKGRKRHLLLDTLGLVLGWFTWLRLLWVDGGYNGECFAQWVQGIRRKLKVEEVKRSDDLKGFEVLPCCWVVERTFGWLMRQRLLVRDYETSESSVQAWVYVAMIRIQLRRLA